MSVVNNRKQKGKSDRALVATREFFTERDRRRKETLGKVMAKKSDIVSYQGSRQRKRIGSVEIAPPTNEPLPIWQMP